MSVSGHPDEPMKVGVSMVDILTSLFAGMGILAALRYRDEVSGRGQYIDLSLLDCGLASLSHFAQNYLVSGEVPVRRGNGGFGGVPSQAFRCKDRPIFIVAGNNQQFEAFCTAAGRADIFADSRFNSTAARIQHRSELLAILDELMLTRTANEWLKLCEQADVPASAINELPDVLDNPQIKHRQMLAEIDHPEAGLLKLLANPIRLSETPITDYSPPPGVGEHTNTVLRDLLGYSDSQIDELVARKII